MLAGHVIAVNVVIVDSCKFEKLNLIKTAHSVDSLHFAVLLITSSRVDLIIT